MAESPALSAGHHFNPTHQDHGGPHDQNRHAGDLGNLVAGADGAVNFKLTDSRISLTGPNCIVGRSVIVHANADDFKSQPVGESGPRLACGVIGIGEPRSSSRCVERFLTRRVDVYFSSDGASRPPDWIP